MAVPPPLRGGAAEATGERLSLTKKVKPARTVAPKKEVVGKLETDKPVESLQLVRVKGTPIFARAPPLPGRALA